MRASCIRPLKDHDPGPGQNKNRTRADVDLNHRLHLIEEQLLRHTAWKPKACRRSNSYHV
jgi:hypothetical protein